jgi:hypothetical protein
MTQHTAKTYIGLHNYKQNKKFKQIIITLHCTEHAYSYTTINKITNQSN